MKWLVRVIGTIWVLAGFVLLGTCWAFDWEVLTGFATWMLTAGIFFVFWQIIEARRSTNAQVAVKLFRELRDEKTLNILREIYELKPNDITRLLSSNEEKDVQLRHRIEGVLDKFELLGALVERGIINEHIAIEAYGGPPVLKCWYQLGENYIEKVRKQRGLFCKYVEDFAAHTLEYQRRYSPKDEWIRFHRGGKGKQINLIEYFEKRPKLCPKRYK